MDVGTLWLRKPISALFIAKELTGWGGGVGVDQHHPQGPAFSMEFLAPSPCGSSSWELKYCRMSHLF